MLLMKTQEDCSGSPMPKKTTSSTKKLRKKKVNI